MSLGELKRLSSYLSVMTVPEPSCSYRTTRRARCSHESWRPSKSKVLPFELFDGLRNTVTRSSSSIHRTRQLLGMSLKTRYPPGPHHAGPSDHSAPVQRRLIAEFACT